MSTYLPSVILVASHTCMNYRGMLIQAWIFFKPKTEMAYKGVRISWLKVEEDKEILNNKTKLITNNNNKKCNVFCLVHIWKTTMVNV